jgi:hypothetical protein
MKRIKLYLLLIAICLLLPLRSFAQMPHSHEAELHVINDTETQVSFHMTTEKYGTKQWTWRPGQDSYPTIPNPDGTNHRVRVRGTDSIEIADWGSREIRDVAEFVDGVWEIRIRHARRELR